MAFRHDIAGGQGNLIATSVQSPNFQLSPFQGWQITKAGTLYAANAVISGTITASVFKGTDFEIDTSGAFFYSGTPANGNLIVSIASAAGTDSFLNAYGADVKVYGSSGTSVQLLAGSPATVRLGTGDASEAVPGLIGTLIDGAGPAGALASQLQAPQVTGETAFAVVRLESSSRDLTTSPPSVLIDVANAGGSNSQVIVDPTDIRLIRNSSLNYLYCDGVNSQLVAGYPLVAASAVGAITAETWHSLGALAAGSGYTVGQGRYQLTSDGRTELDITLTAGAATVAGVYAFANTMPAAYRPVNGRSYPMGWNGSVTAGMNFPSLRVATTGIVNLQLPALPASTVVSCTQRMPVN